MPGGITTGKEEFAVTPEPEGVNGSSTTLGDTNIALHCHITFYYPCNVTILCTLFLYYDAVLIISVM